MRWTRLGRNCYIGRDLEGSPHEIAAGIESLCLPGVLVCTPALETVGLYVDPTTFDERSLPEHVRISPQGQGKEVRIPVRYDGADLEEVAESLHLRPEDIVQLHSGQEYVCVAVGFCPGFPYLKGLPPELAKLPRRASPRTHVTKGSVAVAAGQCGIYPKVISGGWNLLGTTPTEIANEDTLEFLIAPGDRVRFEPL